MRAVLMILHLVVAFPGVASLVTKASTSNKTEIVVEAVQQMNTWTNSIYLSVPVATESFDQRKDDHGLTFIITASTQMSDCKNDGLHRVDDVEHCPPVPTSKLQSWYMEVADFGANARKRYVLMATHPLIKTNSFDDNKTEVVVEAVQQMNTWINSIYLSVPVTTESFEQRRDENVLTYIITASTRMSECKNDGMHRVDDVKHCPPVLTSKLQSWYMEVADFGANASKRYVLMATHPLLETNSSDGNESEIVVEAVQQMNTWINSIFLSVPVTTESFEKKNNQQGLIYIITVSTQMSECKNDGVHRVDDVERCPPVPTSKLQSWYMEMADFGAHVQKRYVLMAAHPLMLV